MNGLKYLIVITNRQYTEQYAEFFDNHDMCGVLDFFGNGTASESTLYYLGLESSEKVVFNLMVKDDEIPRLKHDMITQMNISGIGNGIAVFVPVDGIGGESAKRYLLGEKTIEKGEKNMDANEIKTVLIITVADKGNSEKVMDAARSAGATGGTVVRAKGTGASIAKFFGISISEEKEMIYIVAKRESRDDIMRAIMSMAGKGSDAHGIVFSLPVDSVCGISGME